MVPSLPFEVEGGENNEINYKIISFSAIGGNVQSSLSPIPLASSRFPPVEVTFMFTRALLQLR